MNSELKFQNKNNIDSTFQFKCPICNLPLTLHSASYACKNKHTYDVSREGYVNLLLSQHKRSRHPGDSQEMIKSRQRFLNNGYYQVLSDAIIRCVDISAQTSSQRLLDIGCGEGYYMQQLREVSNRASIPLFLAGIDVSKPGVLLAAKRKIDAQLAVISAFLLPFFDKSFDTVLSIFSPICASETTRILSDNGRIIMVGPGEQHLTGLTSHIYDRTIPHEGNYQVLDTAPEFKLQDQQEIKEIISVKGEDILDLLNMTPYYWHIQLEQKHKLTTLDLLETSIHFYIRTYVKTN